MPSYTKSVASPAWSKCLKQVIRSGLVVIGGDWMLGLTKKDLQRSHASVNVEPYRAPPTKNFFNKNVCETFDFMTSYKRKSHNEQHLSTTNHRSLQTFASKMSGALTLWSRSTCRGRSRARNSVSCHGTGGASRRSEADSLEAHCGKACQSVNLRRKRWSFVWYFFRELCIVGLNFCGNYMNMWYIIYALYSIYMYIPFRSDRSCWDVDLNTT